MNAPAGDELEISIFGRGRGECIVCHVGRQRWVVIDSFNHVGDSGPVALSYLRRMATTFKVELVVATHWDDDHVRGLTKLVEAAKPVVCCFPAVFNSAQAKAFARTWDANWRKEREHAASMGSGLAEFAGVMAASSDARRSWVSEGKSVKTATGATLEFLAPADEVVDRGFAVLGAAQGGRPASPNRRITAVSANTTSVVVRLLCMERTALFGADLEKGQPGWTAAIKSGTSVGKGAEVFKVPHHGSDDADDPAVWAWLCGDRPLAAVTRFNSSGLPRAAACNRLRARTDRAWVLGALGQASRSRRPTPGRKPRPTPETDDFYATAPMIGHLRLRAKPGEDWQPRLRGSFEPLCAD